MAANEVDGLKCNLRERPQALPVADPVALGCDLGTRLEQSGHFADIRVQQTGNLSTMLLVQATAAAHLPPTALARELERIWLAHCGATDQEAHTVTREAGAITLDFVTAAREGEQYRYVTGRIVVGL